MLIDRNMTAKVARNLVQQYGKHIALHVDIFDWLRDADAADPRLTPGRLRRMIEEDWSPPPGFVSRAEREARAVADAERASIAATERSTAAAAARSERAAATVERVALYERLGVREADQGTWRALVDAPPALPIFLREGLFYPPSRETPVAAVILPDTERATRAAALSRTERQRLLQRVADRFRCPVMEVAFFDQADLLRRLTAGGA